jgi:hypothetical protein
MNIAYRLILIVFLLNFPLRVFGCQTEKAPEKVEQQTEQEEENALARLKPETVKIKPGMQSETAGRRHDKRIESMGEYRPRSTLTRARTSKKSSPITTIKIKANNLA